MQDSNSYMIYIIIITCIFCTSLLSLCCYMVYYIKKNNNVIKNIYRYMDIVNHNNSINDEHIIEISNFISRNKIRIDKLTESDFHIIKMVENIDDHLNELDAYINDRSRNTY